MKKLTNNFGIALVSLLLLFIGFSNTSGYCNSSEDMNLQIITEEFAPFNFRSADGKITGQSTEIVREILSRLGLDIEIQIMPWNDGYDLALTKTGVVLYSTFRTNERQNLFQWVGPIASDEMLFYALEGSDTVIRSLEDTKAVTAIGVVKDDARHQLLVQNNATNLKLYPTDAECYRALASGEVELVLGSKNTMADMAALAGVDPSEIKSVYSLRKTPLYIAFNINSAPDIVKEWQSTLDEMKSDGTFDSIYERWGGTAVQDSLRSDASNLQIITEELAPYNFMSKEGEITGQSTEVVREILTRLGQEVEIQLMPWNKGYVLALSKPDVILYSTFRTAERENLFNWVGPIASDEMFFYARKGSDIIIRSLENTKTVGAIGVVKDDARHQLLTKNHITNLKLYRSDVDCYKALASGEVELVLGINHTMAKMAALAGVDPSEFKAVYVLRKTPMYIAFNKNIPVNIVKQWQDALNEMKRDGTFDTINERWGGTAVQGYSKADTNNAITAIAAVKLLAGYVDVRLGEFLAVLQALSFTEEARSGNWKILKSLLVEQESAELAGRIWYLLPDGSYYTTVDNLTSKNLKDRGYFPGLIAGNPVLGSVVVSKSTGKPVAVVAAPIKKNDKVQGALGTSIYMQGINDEVRNTFPLQSDQKFFAVANDGIIALHSDDEWIGQQISNINGNLESKLDEATGECDFTYEGKEWHAVWTTAPKTGWRVLIANVVE